MSYVFKFGGASIKNAEAIQNMVSILQRYQKERLVVVVSASGKTTNALEDVVNAYYNKTDKVKEYLDKVKLKHTEILNTLFPDTTDPIYADIHDAFIDVEWILEEEPQDTYDYLYDQIVSLGEILSTKIVAAYLNKQGVTAAWVDARDCILTDNTYRDANINWEETLKQIQRIVPPLQEKGLVVTQGFIGGTSENFTTTLGREGSDFTASIFSYCLDVKGMAIWKDVPGVLTGDPRIFKDVTLLDKISYGEAIEMTYYGAKVIHPKTIRPLQNKGIPLHVKSFVNPEGAGTVINGEKVAEYPSVIVVKEKQAMLKIVSNDFYFVDEARFAALFNTLAEYRIKVNMTQNTALAFSVCVNNDPDKNEPAKIQALTEALANDYTVSVIDNLKLITIRHATDKMVNRFAKGRKIYLEEKIRGTVQLVMGASEKL
ncbi:MAG: aspartate kinase [Aureispira sp.]|nr:aspartate kinase [Aureispira sp.]